MLLYGTINVKVSMMVKIALSKLAESHQTIYWMSSGLSE